tara:strand:- start:10949 stop:11167 length:219 start_codon:yes stop_codon:yes gene_type:complete
MSIQLIDGQPQLPPDTGSGGIFLHNKTPQHAAGFRDLGQSPAQKMPPRCLKHRTARQTQHGERHEHLPDSAL